MTTVLRLDRTTDYEWVDFPVDQSARWPKTITWRVGDKFSDPVDVSGYDARFVVIRAGLDETPVLDLSSPADITVGDALGTFTWDVPATAMAGFTHPVYQHELILTPAGSPDLAFPLIKGRVLVRASVAPPGVPPVPGTGFGEGGFGLGLFGGGA